MLESDFNRKKAKECSLLEAAPSFPVLWLALALFSSIGKTEVVLGRSKLNFERVLGQGWQGINIKTTWQFGVANHLLLRSVLLILHGFMWRNCMPVCFNQEPEREGRVTTILVSKFSIFCGTSCRPSKRVRQMKADCRLGAYYSAPSYFVGLPQHFSDLKE